MQRLTDKSVYDMNEWQFIHNLIYILYAYKHTQTYIHDTIIYMGKDDQTYNDSIKPHLKKYKINSGTLKLYVRTFL